MTFARRLLRVAALGLAVAAVGAPASYAGTSGFVPQDPYSGEGYGGSMDSGSPVNHAQDPRSGEGYGGSMDSGSPVNYGVVDFWNYDSDSGMRISNYSPGVAAADVDRLNHVPPSSPVRQPSATGSASDGFSWSDAGIGAASVFGLVMLAGAAAALLRRNRKGELARA
jgi:hypothetical protein